MIVIFCSLLVALSFAVTFRMPLASMSKVTSICGTPRGAGGMLPSWNTPSRRLSRAIGALALVDLDLDRRSGCPPPSRTSRSCAVGMVVLRSISLVNTPPSVSMPSDSGVTSSSSTSFTSPPSTPPWTAAPIATTSSGFTPLCGSLPNRSLHHLLDPRHAGRAADQHHFVDLLRRQRRRPTAPACRDPSPAGGCPRPSARTWRASASARRCLGPRASAVMNGRLISVSSIARKLDLGLLGGFLQPLQRHLVLARGRCRSPS